MSVTESDPVVDEAAYRAEAQAWLKANAAEYTEPPATAWSEDELVARAKAWQRKKAAAGYGAIAAPKSIGGAGLSPRIAGIFAAEERRYHTPFYIGQSIGLSMSMSVPSFDSAPRNAATMDCATGSSCANPISMPIWRILSGCCCARAASGHAAAAPPSSVMKWRRFMPDMGVSHPVRWVSRTLSLA